jgi:hypothetical protein
MNQHVPQNMPLKKVKTITHSMELSYFEKQPVAQLFKMSQHFMEPEISLPCSQRPSTGPYSETDQSSP